MVCYKDSKVDTGIIYTEQESDVRYIFFLNSIFIRYMIEGFTVSCNDHYVCKSLPLPKKKYPKHLISKFVIRQWKKHKYK